jgi:TMEM175 potassium channel family protein
MNKSRLEAFSDGVFAIIITIMVLELKVPGGTSLAVVKPLLPVFLCYILSFVFIAIYWGNHHHLMHTVRKINAAIIWANMHLLFWLSLVPFATGWMGINNFDRITVAVYGALLIMNGLAYTILTKAINRTHKEETELTRAIEKGNMKGWISVLLYGASIPIALFVHPAISAALFAIVSIMWIVPSKDIERALENAGKE